MFVKIPGGNRDLKQAEVVAARAAASPCDGRGFLLIIGSAQGEHEHGTGMQIH